MKFTKLSLVAALAVSAAFAGGDITPVPAPVAEFPQTTISGKLTGYYYTDDSVDLFDSESSALGTAVTLDVTHKFNANIAINFSAVGYANLMDDLYFENEEYGAFINVANLTATFMDTTFVLGRQLLNTPMLGGFDWLLAPGSFEAYTAVNTSIENVTLVGSYVRAWRANNGVFKTLPGVDSGWLDLTDIDDGNNWTLSAAYDNQTISGSIWYYNVDAAAAADLFGSKYTQVYVDGGYKLDVAKLAAQYVYTDWDAADASNVFGVKATTTLGAFNLMAAYVNISDNIAGWVGLMDGLYTSSWNTASGASIGNNVKVEAATEFSGLSASASYAYYEYDQSAALTDNDGHEIDVILGYDLKDSGNAIISAIDLNLVYTNTNYGDNSDDVNALEIYANYKF